MRRLDDGRKWAAKALECDDRDKAIDWWKTIFGDEYFPREVEEAASQLAKAGLPGKSYVTAAGLIVPDLSESLPVQQVKRTTFHGKR